MILVKILLIVSCSILWRFGGESRFKWSGYRDVLIPVIMFFYYGFTTNWIIGFLTGGATNIIRMGYGAYNPEGDPKPSHLALLTKDREGWKIRGIYGAITSFFIGLFPFLYCFFIEDNFLALISFLVYIGINTSLEIILDKLNSNVWPTELGNGLGRGSVILFL